MGNKFLLKNYEIDIKLFSFKCKSAIFKGKFFCTFPRPEFLKVLPY